MTESLEWTTFGMATFQWLMFLVSRSITRTGSLLGSTASGSSSSIGGDGSEESSLMSMEGTSTFVKPPVSLCSSYLPIDNKSLLTSDDPLWLSSSSLFPFSVIGYSSATMVSSPSSGPSEVRVNRRRRWVLNELSQKKELFLT